MNVLWREHDGTGWGPLLHREDDVERPGWPVERPSPRENPGPITKAYIRATEEAVLDLFQAKTVRLGWPPGDDK